MLHLGGQFEVPLQRPPLQLALVQAGHRDGHCRLGGHADEQLQFLLLEGVLPIVGLDLDDPERFAFVVDQRRAHERPDPKQRDAFAVGKPRIVSRIAGQDGLLGLNRLVDDGAADAVFAAGRQGLGVDGNQLARVVAEHDAAALRLGQHVEQAVQRLGKEPFEREAAAQVLRDVQQSVQLRLCRGSQPR